MTFSIEYQTALTHFGFLNCCVRTLSDVEQEFVQFVSSHCYKNLIHIMPSIEIQNEIILKAKEIL